MNKSQQQEPTTRRAMKLIEDPIVVVRSSESGVWIGTAVELDGNAIRLTDAYRIWSWEVA